VLAAETATAAAGTTAASAAARSAAATTSAATAGAGEIAVTAATAAARLARTGAATAAATGAATAAASAVPTANCENLFRGQFDRFRHLILPPHTSLYADGLHLYIDINIWTHLPRLTPGLCHGAEYAGHVKRN
jgi:hypothetical protein